MTRPVRKWTELAQNTLHYKILVLYTFAFCKLPINLVDNFILMAQTYY